MNNKIKIIFVSNSTNGGGAERVQVNIIRSLSIEKYDLYFINTGNDPKPIELNHKITYIQYRKKHTRLSIRKLSKDIRRIKPDYVFSTSIVNASLLQAIRKLYFIHFKLIVRIAVPPSELFNKNVKSRILKIINSITLRYADLIIAQTEFSKHDIMAHYFVPYNKITVIRNIIDKEMLESKSREYFPLEFDCNFYNIVAAGSLYSVKGFDLLIDALNIVVNNFKNVKLYILGKELYEIGYEVFLLEKIKKNNLHNNVFLLGYKSNPFPYFKNANLFVMSSRTEGFPNVVLEALYLSTPVVATNCVDFSGIIIDGVNGFIVEKESIISIADGITKSINGLKNLNNVQFENYNFENLFV